MAKWKANSFWLENLLGELTPKKEDMGEYKNTEEALNNLLLIKARNSK